jgi:hypothetical protein
MTDRERMTDREAIEALTDEDVVNPYLTLEALDIAVDALRERVERKNGRKTGKWVFVHPLQDDDCGGYMCSCCNHGSYSVDAKTWKACPWCTALMEVEE